MGALDGRVAIITGAGRGIGREHALLFAKEGAQVVVNDLGGGPDGSGADAGPAHEVVEEIRAIGGEAVANTDNVADWEGGQRLVQTAIDAFGDLHVLVNNAGILRDRMLANMSEEEWDAVIHVHLKGHFVPMRFAAAYWRDQSKAGNAGERVGDQHVVHVGTLRQRRPGQLRRGQDRHRDADDDRPDGARPVRRALQRDRPGGDDAPDRHHPRCGDPAAADGGDGGWNPPIRRTCRRSSPTSPPPTARSRGRVFYVTGGQVGLFQPFAIVDRIQSRSPLDDRGAPESRPPTSPTVEFDLGKPW